MMAHEFLHAGLRHDVRCGSRDPYLWNVACDFVINDWLLEMNVGEPPALGMLHDPQLRGLSAEAIYDLITKNLRRFRKLQTMRGFGKSDILEGAEVDFALLARAPRLTPGTVVPYARVSLITRVADVAYFPWGWWRRLARCKCPSFRGMWNWPVGSTSTSRRLNSAVLMRGSTGARAPRPTSRVPACIHPKNCANRVPSGLSWTRRAR